MLSRDLPCPLVLPARTRPAQRSSNRRIHRHVAAHASASPGAEQRRRDSAPEAQPSSSDASSSEAQDESNDRGPHDQRPLILRIVMSVFMPIWQSISRVFAALPGSNVGRAFMVMAFLGLLGVRAYAVFVVFPRLPPADVCHLPCVVCLHVQGHVLCCTCTGHVSTAGAVRTRACSLCAPRGLQRLAVSYCFATQRIWTVI